MQYDNIIEGSFISRPNRFLADVEIDGARQLAHVKNTSRCRELLTPGAKIYLQRSADPGRKTGWSLIAVEKDGRIFNIDSQAPNKICIEGIRNGRIVLPGLAYPVGSVKAEKVHGDSRLDIYIEEQKEQEIIKAYVEVKGVTLEESGIARFPDAPTERGLKHINELCRIAAGGDLAFIVFILQMKGSGHFEPNDRMHPEFGAALRLAAIEGVRILAYDCLVAADGIAADEPVRVVL